MNRKCIKISKLVLAALLLSLSLNIFSACKNGIVPGQDVINIEYGDTFVVPNEPIYSNNKETENFASYVVTDLVGKTVKVTYGSFYPSIGEYTITYSYEGKKSKTVNVICQDTKGPQVTLTKFVAGALVGNNVNFPLYKLTDVSGVKSGSVTESVKYEDGSIIPIINGAFYVGSAGKYTMTITAEDIVGNKTVFEKILYAGVIEEGSEPEGSIWSFDSMAYENLTSPVESFDLPQNTLILNGCVDKYNNISENGVLKITLENAQKQYIKFFSGLVGSDQISDISDVEMRIMYKGSLFGMEIYTSDMTTIAVLPVRYGEENAWKTLQIPKTIWEKSIDEMIFVVQGRPGVEVYVDYVRANYFGDKKQYFDNALQFKDSRSMLIVNNPGWAKSRLVEDGNKTVLYTSCSDYSLHNGSANGFLGTARILTGGAYKLKEIESINITLKRNPDKNSEYDTTCIWINRQMLDILAPSGVGTAIGNRFITNNYVQKFKPSSGSYELYKTISIKQSQILALDYDMSQSELLEMPIEDISFGTGLDIAPTGKTRISYFLIDKIEFVTK